MYWGKKDNLHCAESWFICRNKSTDEIMYVPKYCRCKMINQFIVKKRIEEKKYILLLCNFKTIKKYSAGKCSGLLYTY